MRYIQNEKGVALVMVLIFAMVGLAIVSAMLFMLTQGTMMSGANKMFKSADEAGLGGVAAAVDMVKNRGITNLGTVVLDACLQDKLTLTRGTWGTTNWVNCTPPVINTADSAKRHSFTIEATNDIPDVTRNFPGPPGTTFTMQAKIVDTVRGNSDVSGLVTSGSLGGAGTVASNSGQVTPPPIPYLYRIEVQTQNTANPAENSRYSALYAY
ncbi:MAG: hypothetical protein C0402_01725 [Thermodesulfovibrio sp.]|nr:hypothetical protein [Thermodesulfovibrio sp.]